MLRNPSPAQFTGRGYQPQGAAVPQTEPGTAGLTVLGLDQLNLDPHQLSVEPPFFDRTGDRLGL